MTEGVNGGAQDFACFFSFFFFWHQLLLGISVPNVASANLWTWPWRGFMPSYFFRLRHWCHNSKSPTQASFLFLNSSMEASRLPFCTPKFFICNYTSTSDALCISLMHAMGVTHRVSNAADATDQHFMRDQNKWVQNRIKKITTLMKLYTNKARSKDN